MVPPIYWMREVKLSRTEVHQSERELMLGEEAPVAAFSEDNILGVADRSTLLSSIFS